MYKSYDYDKSKGVALNNLLNARSDYKKMRRNRVVASVADFATNLLELVGRNKGLRYSVAGQNLAPKVSPAFEEAQERYRKALVDYKGFLAAETLKNNTSQGSLNIPSVSKSPFLLNYSKENVAFKNPSRANSLEKALTFKNPREKSSFSSPSASYLKSVTGPYGDILYKIKNIKTPKWYINNKK